MAPILIFSEPKNAITCTICTDLIEILDNSVTEDFTIEQVHDILYLACSNFVEIEQDCQHFVDTNLLKICDLLLANENLSPHAICGELYLCV